MAAGVSEKPLFHDGELQQCRNMLNARIVLMSCMHEGASAGNDGSHARSIIIDHCHLRIFGLVLVVNLVCCTAVMLPQTCQHPARLLC
jgi:hypothetical protein